MAIQDDNTILMKSDLKAYHEAIAPMLGGSFMLSTNVGDYYSTDEKIVGVWTDGKPVYQKVITCKMPTITDGTETGVETFLADNIDKLIGVQGIHDWADSAGRLGSIPDCYLTGSSVRYIRYYLTPSTSVIRTVSNRSLFSNSNVLYIACYTKTTDVANSAATTPGAYDINFPNTWPENKEIFFGNGLYGKRFIGTFTSPTSFNTNIAQLDTIDRGTTFKFINRGGNIFRRNDTAMPLGVQDTLQYDIWYANSSSSQDVGLRLRGKDNGAYSCSYDIWVTYTK